ncbi:MAG: aldo/keto reductase [Erysipelotrichales bacterium]|nr:aldo/keto reductase [Erysipelotrichales bacterium]
MADYFGKETPKLGFGLMRLPRKGIGIDIEQVKTMVDLFLEAGFTYFDTAPLYPGSEAAIKKALVERYPRESYTLATKINAFILAPTEKACKNQFYNSLKRTGAGYFDYYLLHSIMENNYTKYDKYHIWDFVKDLKKQGLVKHIGFSYHSGPELLDKLLTAHPEVDFIQLQINYADWENPSVTSRANYEVARKHGVSMTVMEPIKGGRLANPPEEVKKLMKEVRPELSYASWAIRFAASLDGIITVLSGMSNIDQMKDNLSYMKNFRPLDEKERKVIEEAQKIFGNSSAIPCTACHYCTEGCPMGIPIPEVFKAMNVRLANGQMEEAQTAYEEATQNAGKAIDCVECRQCEGACPQHLPITDYLKKASEMFGEN